MHVTQVTKLSSGGDFKAVQAASLELSKLTEDVETMEWRHMELAEINGDL